MAPTDAETRATLRGRFQSHGITVLAVLIVVISLAGLAAATGWAETGAALARLSGQEVAVLLMLSLVNYGLRGLRWHLFCGAIGLRLSLWRGLRHYLAGFAMTVTPGRLGELVRLRWIHQETGFAYDRAVPLVVLDRAADLAAVGLLLALGIALAAGASQGLVPVAILALGAAVLVTRAGLAHWAVTRVWQRVGLWPRLFARARRAARTLGPLSRPAVLVPALFLGGLGWFAEAYAFHLLLVWFGAEVELWTAALIFLAAMVTGGATGTPGGLGGVEAAMIALLSLQGIGFEIALPATFIIRLTTLWFAIAIGVLLFPMTSWAADRAAALR